MKFAHDKQDHFVYGIALFSVIYIFSTEHHLGAIIGVSDLLIPWAALILSAASKELWDRAGHGTPEFLDFLATVAGGVFIQIFAIGGALAWGMIWAVDLLGF